MGKGFSEIVVLLVEVTRWLILASVTGVVVGLSTTGILKCLDLLLHVASLYSYGLYLLPFGLMLSSWITSSLAPEAGGQGLERLIQAIHYRSGKIHAKVIPAKLIATLLTIGVGGSAGTIGPCAQIGGGLASIFSSVCRLGDSDRKTLVICGISAGFAAVLGAPIAAAFFGVEALFVGALAYQVLLPSVIAAMVSHQIALAFGIQYWNFSLDSVQSFSISIFPWVIAGGIIFGLCAILLIEGITLGTRLSLRVKAPPVLKGLLGGLLILGVVLLTSQKVLGLGLDGIQGTIRGEHVVWYLFLIKILVTSITLNFGGSGGVILPVCFIGSTAGALLGTLFNLPSDLFAALGLAGLLAAAINTPITAVLLAIELFGLPVGTYAIVICSISFLISGHRSAIPTQLLAINKALAIQTTLKEEISKTKPEIEPWHKQWKSYQDVLKQYALRSKKSDEIEPKIDNPNE